KAAMRSACARPGTCCRPGSGSVGRHAHAIAPQGRLLDRAGAPRAHTMIGQGPFALTGPQPRPDPRRLPLRGDLAHIGLAGRYFVPHYAVPQPRAVLPGGAPLLSAPGEGGEEICTLME